MSFRKGIEPSLCTAEASQTAATMALLRHCTRQLERFITPLTTTPPHPADPLPTGQKPNTGGSASQSLEEKAKILLAPPLPALMALSLSITNFSSSLLLTTG